MSPAASALAIFVAVFAIATLRRVHLGILMFPAAGAVGVWLAGLTLREVLGGFPVNIMVLLVGVTYFFGIAQVNGTIDRLIGAILGRVGRRPAVLPFVFLTLTAAIASMGSPIAGLVLAPIAMPVGRQAGVDPMRMAVAINAGISAGGFAPTSLFGIVTYGTARQAGIDLNPFTLLAVALAANLAVLVAAFPIFRDVPRDGARLDPGEASEAPMAGVADPMPPGFAWRHVMTTLCMIGLVAGVIACVLAGIEPDIGVIALAFGAALALIDPGSGAKAVSRIDWSTVLMVGGIITFVGVLQKVGSVDMLGQAALQIGTPLVAALVVCAIGALVSAFASTTGILAALVPLAVPLVASGGVAGWALISALGVSATLVDVSPFSTTGATIVASAAADERPRLRSLMIRWGLSMVIVGPTVVLGILLLFSRL